MEHPSAAPVFVGIDVAKDPLDVHLRPIRSGCSVPCRHQCCISMTTKLILTSNLAAVARRDAPPSIAPTTPSRRSTG